MTIPERLRALAPFLRREDHEAELLAIADELEAAHAAFAGMKIVENPSLPAGTVELRTERDRVVVLR